MVWFRQDLRLADNPALQAALQSGEAILPLYIWDPEPDWQAGAASRVWLYQSLRALDQSLQALGSRLILRQGPAEAVLQTLLSESQATGICWNRCYEPCLIARDTALKQKLRAQGVQVRSFKAALLFEPWEIQTQSGGPYKVFTPFWRNCLSQARSFKPLPAPTKLPSVPPELSSESLDQWPLLPRIPWDQGIRSTWPVGEAAAQKRLQEFCQQALSAYAEQRNFPALEGSSKLSPHLHFGEISPRQIWAAVSSLPASEGQRVYLSEIGWREFAHHVLYYFPHTPTEPLNPTFVDFWRDNADLLRQWQRGQTGYPIVDAGMRELWQTGWMHNRVRMIVASFLTKDLLLPWQRGAEWFWDTLVDADLANNTLGWQWAGGCGADAAPYFRIFNPITQSQKFDAQGQYLCQWLPELAALPNKYRHQPWAAPTEVLQAAGLTLGRDYPKPIVDHAEARKLALAAFAALKQR